MGRSALFKLKSCYVFSKPIVKARVKGGVLKAPAGAKSMTVKVIKAHKEKTTLASTGAPITLTFLQLDADVPDFGGMWICDKDHKTGKTRAVKVPKSKLKSAMGKASSIAKVMSATKTTTTTKATISSSSSSSSVTVVDVVNVAEVSKEAHTKAVEEVKAAAAHRHKTLSRWVRAGTRAGVESLGKEKLKVQLDALSTTATAAKDAALAAQETEVLAANEKDLAAQLELQRQQHAADVAEKRAEINAIQARTATLAETEAAAIRSTVDCIVLEVALKDLRRKERKFGAPPPRRVRSPRRSKAGRSFDGDDYDDEDEGDEVKRDGECDDYEVCLVEKKLDQREWPADGRLGVRKGKKGGRKKGKKKQGLKLKARRAAWKAKTKRGKVNIASPTRAKTNPIAMLAMTEMQREMMLLRYPIEQAQILRERWEVMLARHAGEKEGFGECEERASFFLCASLLSSLRSYTPPRFPSSPLPPPPPPPPPLDVGTRIERFAPSEVCGMSVNETRMRSENMVIFD